MRRQPHFLVIGASKSGTSSFCIMLEQHPRVSMTRPREPNFFSVHYEKGWEWYEQRFPDPVEDGIFGDKSPTYSHVQAHPKVAERIHNELPEAKLIYVVRNPLDRIESRWMQDRASGRYDNYDDFNSAVRGNVYGIVDTTRYMQQLDVHRQYFSDDRIKVVFFEDLLARPNDLIRETLEFLGIRDETFTLADVPHTNPSLGKQEDGVLLRNLRRLLPEDTRRLPIPGVLRTAARTTLKREVNARPRWDSATLAWLIDELSEETQAFLRRYRGDPNFWKLERN